MDKKSSRWQRAAIVFLVVTSSIRPSESLSVPSGKSRSKRELMNGEASSSVQVSAETTERSLHILVEQWNVPASPTVIQSLQQCNALANAIIKIPDPSLFFEKVGRIRQDRLLQMIERHPLLLASALTSTQLVSIQAFLMESLGLTEEQWNRLRRKAKVSTWRRANVRRIIRLLLGCMDKDQVAKVILAQPKLFSYNMERLNEPITYFSEELGITRDEIRRMILIWPVILTLNVETNLRPTVLFLRSLGSEAWDGWRRMIIRYPQLLTHSVERVLQPKLKFLQTTLLELNTYDSVRRVVAYFPPIFWLSQEILLHKVEYLKRKLDLSPEEIRGVVLTFPQVLGLSVDQNLEPTIDFYRTCMTEKQLKDFFLYQPSLLAYSLEKRIKPRIEILQATGIEFAYSPPSLMSFTDYKFQQW